MRILVTGGTVFLSHAVAEAAAGRGHAVICAARGTSGQPPAGTTLVEVDWTRPGGFSPLVGMTADVVIDVAYRDRDQVRALAEAIGSHVGHWIFVSTCLVYRDRATPGQRADAPVIEADETGALYPAVKRASEEIVMRRFPRNALIVRPGLIVGPGDRSDRFGYWPARLAQGGLVLAPGVPGDVIQWIDVRDLAQWLVQSAEQHRTGIVDAVGQPMRFGDALSTMALAVGSNARLMWTPQEFLLSVGVMPWSGRCSLPLWVRRPEEAGLLARDPAPALAEGLRLRGLTDTALAALDWERRLGLARRRKAGLTPDDECMVLHHWHRINAGRDTSSEPGHAETS